jgi:hypothetical protein
LYKFNSILVSWKVLVKLEGEDMAISQLGSALLLLDNLFLDISLEEVEKAWGHLKFKFLLAHKLRHKVVVASLVQKLKLGHLVGLVVKSVELKDHEEAVRLGEADSGLLHESLSSFRFLGVKNV